LCHVLGLLRQVAGGLRHLHALGIVHGDVKPANVLLDAAGGVAKLADFGHARLISDQEMMKTACGTPGYVAPEVLKNKG
jgi:serine/threonine protein kinase